MTVDGEIGAALAAVRERVAAAAERLLIFNAEFFIFNIFFRDFG